MKRSLPWIETTLQDLRFALRSWSKAPTFAAAAIATLALGIGANAAIFSIVSGVLLRPLPYFEPDRLVEVNETQPRDGSSVGFDGPVVYNDFDQWRTHSTLVERMITYLQSRRSLQGRGDPERVITVAAERGVFPLLGVSAFLGRTFGDGDSPNVAVASYGYWKEHLGADTSAIGHTVTIDGQPFTGPDLMPFADGEGELVITIERESHLAPVVVSARLSAAERRALFANPHDWNGRLGRDPLHVALQIDVEHRVADHEHVDVARSLQQLDETGPFD